MDCEDTGRSFRFLLRDDDHKFSRVFDARFNAAAIEVLTTPIQAPRANVTAERFVGSLRRELLDRILVVNQCSRPGHGTTVRLVVPIPHSLSNNGGTPTTTRPPTTAPPTTAPPTAASPASAAGGRVTGWIGEPRRGDEMGGRIRASLARR